MICFVHCSVQKIGGEKGLDCQSFDKELSLLRVDVEDTDSGWGCISPQQSRRMYVHVAMIVLIRSNISIVVKTTFDL